MKFLDDRELDQRIEKERQVRTTREVQFSEAKRLNDILVCLGNDTWIEVYVPGVGTYTMLGMPWLASVIEEIEALFKRAVRNRLNEIVAEWDGLDAPEQDTEFDPDAVTMNTPEFRARLALAKVKRALAELAAALPPELDFAHYHGDGEAWLPHFDELAATIQGWELEVFGNERTEKMRAADQHRIDAALQPSWVLTKCVGFTKKIAAMPLRSCSMCDDAAHVQEAREIVGTFPPEVST